MVNLLCLFNQFSGSHHIGNLDSALGPTIVIRILAILARHQQWIALSSFDVAQAPARRLSLLHIAASMLHWDVGPLLVSSLD